jgi:hypothetical protein
VGEYRWDFCVLCRAGFVELEKVRVMQMESMEWTCRNCGGTGKVKYPTSKIEESMLIICSHCSKPSAYAWCKECGMGGEVTGINFSNFQMSWKCAGCDSTYNLSKDFYSNPIAFSPIKFSDVHKLEFKRDIREQKHIPAWVKKMMQFWEEKLKYFLYVYVAIGVLVLFFVTLGSYLALGCAANYSINNPGTTICLNILLVTDGLIVLIFLMFILNPLAQLFFGVASIMFSVIYKFRKSSE